MIKYKGSKKVKLITIVGNVASGKTTLTAILAKALKARKIDADKLYLSNPFFPLTIKDRKRWSLTSDLWFLKERIKLMKKINRNGGKHLIIDSGLPMSWVYAHSRLKNSFYKKDEWQLYESLFSDSTNQLPKTDLVIVLTGSTKYLLNQIDKRGRDYELKYFDQKYLKSLNTSLQCYIRKCRQQKIKLIIINREKHDLTNLIELKKLIKKINNYYA
jgi:deoxyadenosine/deoxycytidine kinase